jgi:hypothetical protein
MSDDHHAVQTVGRILAGLPVDPAAPAGLAPPWRTLADAIPPAAPPKTIATLFAHTHDHL